MSDSSRASDDTPGNAERLLRALAGVAGDASARERLDALGDRARAVVEEISRASRLRSEEAAQNRTAPPSSEAEPSRVPDDLADRLLELRANVAAVSDVLEATVERLESLEDSIGDPDGVREQQLVAGLERCERVLQGIEHVTRRERRIPTLAVEPVPVLRVLVACTASRERAELCVLLERQGLRTLAALDRASALASVAQYAPDAAILVAGGWEDGFDSFLEEWKVQNECGLRPPAIVVGAREHAQTLDLMTMEADYGGAALAAALQRLLEQKRGDTIAPSERVDAPDLPIRDHEEE